MAEVINNLMRILGVRPGYDMDSLRVYPRKFDDLTQIVQRGSLTNTTDVLYTVPSGKILYLCTAHAILSNESGGTSYGYIRIRNDSNGVVFTFLMGEVKDETILTATCHYNPPLEMSEDWHFYGRSDVNLLYARISFFGYII